MIELVNDRMIEWGSIVFSVEIKILFSNIIFVKELMVGVVFCFCK